MFCFVLFLYWTQSKKFVDIAQQCFAFTTCVLNSEHKSKFKSCRILTRFRRGLFRSLGLFYFHCEADFNLHRPFTYSQWTYHEHNVNTLWTYCEETADLKFWFTTSTVKIRGEASSGSRPRRQKERGNYSTLIQNTLSSLFFPNFQFEISSWIFSKFQLDFSPVKFKFEISGFYRFDS